MTRLNKYFLRKEFKCKCGECSQDTVDKELVDVLSDLRKSLNAPVVITSGNRCPEYNKKVGGAENSFHLVSKAADIKVIGHSPEDIYEYLDNKYKNKYGLGLYKTWVHIDVREEKARW